MHNSSQSTVSAEEDYYAENDKDLDVFEYQQDDWHPAPFRFLYHGDSQEQDNSSNIKYLFHEER